MGQKRDSPEKQERECYFSMSQTSSDSELRHEGNRIVAIRRIIQINQDFDEKPLRQASTAGATTWRRYVEFGLLPHQPDFPGAEG